MEMTRFLGKVVLVTGGNSGLGRAQVKRFAAEGANVAINHLPGEQYQNEADALVSELTNAYGNFYKAYAADVSNEVDVDRMITDVVDHFGKIDVLVNNAGISINGTLKSCTSEAWDKTLAVNLTGSYYCAKYAAKYMKERSYGRIVNLSSVVGLTGARGTIAYGTTKAALIGLMKNIAREVGRKGITVNCIAPGYIDAGMVRGISDDYKQEVIASIPMGRWGTEKDVANAVAFLASDDAGYITGEVLRVDGGFAM